MKSRFSIIETLEAARETQGMTQAELASRAGTSRVTVGRIEAGFDPKLSTLYELARALGLELTLVPKSLAGEVQAFLRSGGRALAQPVGASAPPSVVDLAAVLAQGPRLLADHLTAVARIDESTQVSMSARPLNLIKRNGKPIISESAALTLGLLPQKKTGKNTKKTLRGK